MWVAMDLYLSSFPITSGVWGTSLSPNLPTVIFDTSSSCTQRAAQCCQFHTWVSLPFPCSSCTCPGSDTSHLDCCNKSKALPHHPCNCKDDAATLCHPSPATE